VVQKQVYLLFLDSFTPVDFQGQKSEVLLSREAKNGEPGMKAHKQVVYSDSDIETIEGVSGKRG